MSLGLRESGDETGHDVEEPHGDQEPCDFDRQVVLGAFERWRKEVDKLRSKDTGEDRNNHETQGPDEGHLVDQLTSMFGILVAVVDIPGLDQRADTDTNDPQQNTGHHHADQERIRDAGRPPVVRHDSITREPDKLAEKRYYT